MTRSKSQTLALVSRVSRVGKRDGERFRSPSEQVAIAKARAEREGFGVKIFGADTKGEGVSGACPFDERPGMSKALAEVEAGRLAGIVVSALDRLVREDPETGVTLAAFQRRIRDAGAILLVADNGAAEVLDPDADKLEDVEEWTLAAPNLAHAIHRREARRRWRRAKRNAIERGVYVGSAPAGYRKRADGVLEPNRHADAIRDAFTLRARGGSSSEVAALLTARGVPTSREVANAKREGRQPVGSRWSLKAAASLIENEAYCGVAEVEGLARNETAHAPLVARGVFRKANERKRTAPGRAPSIGGLLSGILRCDACGHRLTFDYTTRDGRLYRFYRCRNVGVCPSKPRPAIGAAPVEAFVLEAVRNALAKSHLEVSKRTDATAPLREARNVAAASLDAWRRLGDAGVAETDPQGYATEYAERKATLDAAEAELDKAEAFEATSSYGTPVEVFDTLDLPERRRVIGQVLGWALDGKALHVKPGRGAVAERIAIH